MTQEAEAPKAEKAGAEPTSPARVRSMIRRSRSRMARLAQLLPPDSAAPSVPQGQLWSPVTRRQVENLARAILDDVVVEVCDPAPRDQIREETGFDGCAVVYLWVDAQGRIRYIGKSKRASGTPLADRSQEHCRASEKSADWVAAAAVWLAGDVDDHQIRAVETRLIRTLRPPDNIIGLRTS